MTNSIINNRKDIFGLSGITSGLFYPGFTKYLSDYKSSSARSYSTEDIFNQIKKSFVSENNKIHKPEGWYFPVIDFENQHDLEQYEKIVSSIPNKRVFSYKMVSNHSRDNIKPPFGWYAPAHRKYKVSSPGTKRKAFLSNYKYSVRFTHAAISGKFDEKTFDALKKFIWNFYIQEKYPVEDYIFQCFCLEHYFDKKDIVNQGIKVFFKTEEDALQFSFSLGSLFGSFVDIF